MKMEIWLEIMPCRSLALALLFSMVSWSQTAVTITVHPGSPGASIPRDFIGFSTETGRLTGSVTPMFPFGNPVLQRLIAQVGPGILRFGGHSVDLLTGWERGQRTASTSTSVITSSDADQAFGFARTLGWRVLWAVNLGNGSSSDDADEAAYVYQTAADVLLGLEIGNEPNVYSRNGLRSSTYTFSDYAAEWQTYANAIQSRVPSAALTGPAAVGADVTGTWILPFAQQFGSRIAVLTQHYYALSPTAAPGSPDAPTLANLLGDAMRMAEDSDGAELQQEAQKQRIAWRMSETNSCFGATPAGVSDALAAALWGIDYMFTMAGRNATGVNFHDVPATGGITPIKITGEEITPMPLYYATLMFHAASKGHLVPADVAANGVNLTAYGVLDDDFTLRVTVINKDETRGAALSIAPGAGYRSALVMRLSGPALTATSGVTLGGASVAADGSWSPRQLENGSVSGGRFQTTVPSGSAALVTFAQGSPRGRCRGNCTSKGILAENPVLRGSHDVYHPKNDVP